MQLAPPRELLRLALIADHVFAFVPRTPLHDGVVAEHVPSRGAEPLPAIEHDEQSSRRGESPFDQLAQERGVRVFIFGRGLHEHVHSFLAAVAEHGTIFDAQVCLVFQNYIDHPDAYSFTTSSLAPLKAVLPIASAMFARARQAPNLKMVFGTDAVALAHGRNAGELTCRVNAG